MHLLTPRSSIGKPGAAAAARRLGAKASKPRFATSDKLFWVILRRLWPRWRQVLILVQPETVIRWHRAGFKLYWTWLSRHRASAGRECVSWELRDLIFRMVTDNSTWGAPRIHGELKMLGFDISERTVLRWMRKAPRDPKPAERWMTFLSNHREGSSKTFKNSPRPTPHSCFPIAT